MNYITSTDKIIYVPWMWWRIEKGEEWNWINQVVVNTQDIIGNLLNVHYSILSNKSDTALLNRAKKLNIQQKGIEEACCYLVGVLKREKPTMLLSHSQWSLLLMQSIIDNPVLLDFIKHIELIAPSTWYDIEYAYHRIRAPEKDNWGMYEYIHESGLYLPDSYLSIIDSKKNINLFDLFLSVLKDKKWQWEFKIVYSPSDPVVNWWIDIKESISKGVDLSITTGEITRFNSIQFDDYSFNLSINIIMWWHDIVWEYMKNKNFI